MLVSRGQTSLPRRCMLIAFSTEYKSLILKAIRPCAEERSGHARLTACMLSEENVTVSGGTHAFS